MHAQGTIDFRLPIATCWLAFCLVLACTLTVNAATGHTVIITTTGTVNTNPGGNVVNCDLWTDADGIPDCSYVTSAPECGPLPFMARVGFWDGGWFVVGTWWSRNFTKGGTLILEVNDWVYDHHDGAFTLCVLVE